MKKIQFLVLLLSWTSLSFAQVNKMEAFQIGTKLAFYPDQCGNVIPEAQGKLTFCDKAGNLGVVERSYGLSYRGVKMMFANHYNDDEVYLTRNGVSIRLSNGTWENIPNVATPPYDGSLPPTIIEGIISPSGKMIFATTNNYSMMVVYDRTNKKVSTESFPVGVYPYLFAYDTDRNFTWVLARQGNKVYLYRYDESALIQIAELSEPGVSGSGPITYYNNHIYLGNANGLFDFDVSNYTTSVPIKHYNTTSTPSLPFDRVGGFDFDANGKLWLAMSENYNGAIVKFNPANGDSELFQLPLLNNPNSNHRFVSLAIEGSTGHLWAVASNYSGLVELKFDGSTPVWQFLSKDSLATLGVPYTYVPKNVYYQNNQLYFTTSDGSSGSNDNFEVLINKNGVWSGRNDNENGNLSHRMSRRFNFAAPDDIGGAWWFNYFDDIVVYRDKDDNHQYINLDIGSTAAIDVDQKAIVRGGSPSELRKIEFPGALSIQQEINVATGMQRVGNQVWIYDNNTPKIDVYENNILVTTYELDNEDYQYYHRFTVDDDNNAWFMRSNGSGGSLIRRFNTTSLISETYDRSEKLGSHLSLTSGPGNSVWFIGRKGVMLYNEANWYPFLSPEFSEFFNVVDGVVDENGKFYVLRNDNAAITTIENPTSASPLLQTTFIEGYNSILPALKHYRPGAIMIDSEGSVWTHASQNAFKLIDDDFAKEYRVSKVVANKNLSNQLDFEIYPNPSNGQVTIKSEMIIKKIDVYATTGQRVFTKMNTKAINLQLSTGIYMVKVISSKGVGVQKLIVE